MLHRSIFKSGYTSFRSGKGHQDFPSLLKDLHSGVLELGDNAEVLSHDEPGEKRFGFDLCFTDINSDRYEWWEFYITFDNWNKTKENLPIKLKNALCNNRARIAALMQAGSSYEELVYKL